MLLSLSRDNVQPRIMFRRAGRRNGEAARPGSNGARMRGSLPKGREGFAGQPRQGPGNAAEARFSGLTGRGTLPMFRRNFRGASHPRERVAQLVEQLTFNQ